MSAAVNLDSVAPPPNFAETPVLLSPCVAEALVPSELLVTMKAGISRDLVRLSSQSQFLSVDIHISISPFSTLIPNYIPLHR